MHWIILPSNEAEFNLLILDSFRRLLEDIRTAALRCGKTEEKRFQQQCESLIQAKGYPTDFLTYWHLNKASFSKWLSSDRDTIHRQEMLLLREAIERYMELTDHAEIIIKKWENLEHQNNSVEFQKALKKLKDEKLICQEAHDEDFYIISDCIVYCSHFLEHGILYLVTNDSACYSTVKSIIQFTTEKKETFCIRGFDCKYPHELLAALKALTQNKVKTS
jgi:hypothetical protein